MFSKNLEPTKPLFIGIESLFSSFGKKMLTPQALCFTLNLRQGKQAPLTMEIQDERD
jgi:hypothetical protein